MQIHSTIRPHVSSLTTTGSLSGQGVDRKEVSQEQANEMRDQFDGQLDQVLSADGSVADLDKAPNSVHIQMGGQDIKASTQDTENGSQVVMSVSVPEAGVESHVFAQESDQGFLFVQGSTAPGMDHNVIAFNFDQSEGTYMTETLGGPNQF